MRVTLDIFSGRPNPTWRLPEAEVAQLAERLRPEMGNAEITSGRLGLRGIYLAPDPDDERLPGWLSARGDGASFAALRTGDSGFADTAQAVLAASRGVVDDALLKLARDAIDPGPAPAAATPDAGDTKGLGPDTQAMLARPPAETVRRFVTPYEPGFWNSPLIRPFNNCYNYAINFASNTVGQPGRFSRRIYSGFTCREVLRAATADGLSDVAAPTSRIVALAVWPGWDFHWWRLHSEGFWAHKLGLSTARNHDNSNLIIGFGRTPETCDRRPYSQFCGFFDAPVGMRVL